MKIRKTSYIKGILKQMINQYSATPMMSNRQCEVMADYRTEH